MSVSMDKSISIESQIRGDRYRNLALEDLKCNDVKSALKNIQLAESLQSDDHNRMAAINMVKARIEYKLKNYSDALFLTRTAEMEIRQVEAATEPTCQGTNSLYKLKICIACDEPKHLIGLQLDRIIESETDPTIVKRAKSIAKGKLWNWLDDLRYI